MITVDNPYGLTSIKGALGEFIDYKVVTDGLSADAVAQMTGDHRIASTLTNPKVALLSLQNNRYKFKMYRYDAEQDAVWYEPLRDRYLAFWRERE